MLERSSVLVVPRAARSYAAGVHGSPYRVPAHRPEALGHKERQRFDERDWWVIAEIAFWAIRIVMGLFMTL
jgi:hypothetical protein